MTTEPENPGEPGIYLEVRIDDASARVAFAARLPRVTRSVLRAPLLTPAAITLFVRPAAELGVAVLDANGATLDAFGWPRRSATFYDRSMDEEEREIEGRPQFSDAAFRVLRLPISESANYLFFYWSELVYDEANTRQRRLVLRQRPLNLYHIGRGEPPAELDVAVRDIRARLPVSTLRLESRRRRSPEWPSHNRIAGHQTLVFSGDPAERFDIVIMGDGFSTLQLPVFDARAADLANRLIAMEPFATLASRINIHTVRTVSIDDGITDCPAAAARRTFLGARGNFNGQFNGFIGVDDPELVYQAGEIIAPREYLEVFVIIANCPVEGGSADPDHRFAFVTMYADLTRFANVAAHEMNHVLTGAAEEYIGCGEAEPLHVYPNQGTESELQSQSLPWMALARIDEKASDGSFRAIHRLGDPFDANHEPIVDPQLTGMLGAYWGCQDIVPDGSGSTACDPYEDPRGATFLRGMARCKMRKSFFDFCRVCADRLTTAIVDSSS